MNPNLGTTSKSREWWYVNVHLRIFRFATTYNTSVRRLSATVSINGWLTG